jgi:hypothetical protein
MIYQILFTLSYSKKNMVSMVKLIENSQMETTTAYFDLIPSWMEEVDQLAEPV